MVATSYYYLENLKPLTLKMQSIYALMLHTAIAPKLNITPM